MYMTTQLMRAKIHQARVTAADVNYVGSITIDGDLIDTVGILPYERVQVVDLENGNRLETYVLRGDPGSGTIQLNGAAARLVSVGDRVIIMAYSTVSLPLEEEWHPKVVVLDARNRVAHWVDNGRVLVA
jgi:aspartate 1-decarboxylase